MTRSGIDCVSSLHSIGTVFSSILQHGKMIFGNFRWTSPLKILRSSWGSPVLGGCQSDHHCEGSWSNGTWPHWRIYAEPREWPQENTESAAFKRGQAAIYQISLYKITFLFWQQFLFWGLHVELSARWTTDTHPLWAYIELVRTFLLSHCTRVDRLCVLKQNRFS